MSAALVCRGYQTFHILLMNALVGTKVHRPELVEDKWATATANPKLPKDHRTGRVQRYRDGDDEHQGRNDDERPRCNDEIDASFEPIAGFRRSRWRFERERLDGMRSGFSRDKRIE